jgi:beta-glucosidase
MGGKIEVSATIKNTGKYDAEEVVQLYVRDLFGNVTRPVKELKGFKKIHLKAGEEKVVTFSLSTGDLAFWNIDMKYAAESGDFTLWVGGDSQKGLKADFTIK